MQKTNEKVTQILKALGASDEKCQEFLIVFDACAPEKQEKVLQVLILEASLFYSRQKEKLQKIRKVKAKCRRFFENQDTEEKVSALEQQISTL